MKLPFAMSLSLLLLLASCADGQSADASCGIDLKNLPGLLRSIQPLFDEGFGDAEIQALQRLAETTPVGQTPVKTYSVSYKGKKVSLRVELHKDDVDALEVWFITHKELAAEIQRKMRETLR